MKPGGETISSASSSFNQQALRWYDLAGGRSG